MYVIYILKQPNYPSDEKVLLTKCTFQLYMPCVHLGLLGGIVRKQRSRYVNETFEVRKVHNAEA